MSYQPEEHLHLAPLKADGNAFLITPSRQGINQQLNDLLHLRSFRRNGASNEVQRYGGLGGIILEGAPGIGKSEFVISALRVQGYVEVREYQNTQIPVPENAFYRMPVSMELEEKKKLLLKAFHEGAVVIIDEINSSPMMERFLNALFMGKTPEGERPNKPGFMIIGTQNPVTMAGRRAPSTALARRLLTSTLPIYTTDEMNVILVSNGLPPNRAFALVEAYEHNVHKAQKEHLTPAPTFRDLLHLAQKVAKGAAAENRIAKQNTQEQRRRARHSQPVQNESGKPVKAEVIASAANREKATDGEKEAEVAMSAADKLSKSVNKLRERLVKEYKNQIKNINTIQTKYQKDNSL